MVSDIVIDEIRQQVKTLAVKLYKRNPNQLAVVPGMTIERRIDMIFDAPSRLVFAELAYKEEIHALNLAFDDHFKGDRVFALMVGLTSMLRQSYGYQNELFLYRELDAQKLYNSARNIEVLAWKLSQQKQKTGLQYIVTNRQNGVIDNLSFERIYGKLISIQDVMAKIIADKQNRTIKGVIQGTLSVFLPI